VRTGLPEDYAPALVQTADGYLWIGTNGGLWA
jgi:ligand-binding sensor domain-containing protein